MYSTLWLVIFGGAKFCQSLRINFRGFNFHDNHPNERVVLNMQCTPLLDDVIMSVCACAGHAQYMDQMQH